MGPVRTGLGQWALMDSVESCSMLLHRQELDGLSCEGLGADCGLGPCTARNI